jgi:AcrR family transcriptional regulator
MSIRDRPRRDVERNHEAILTAAFAVLADDPQATMAEIATASGTGRSTLYRHFPDREALIEAIAKRVYAEVEEIVTRWLPDRSEDPPAQVIAGLCDAVAAMAERYRFLEYHQALLTAKRHPDRPRLIGRLLTDYIAEQQTAGQIRGDLPADWLVAMLGAVIKHGAGRSSAPERTRLMHATVSSLLTPPAGAP